MSKDPSLCSARPHTDTRNTHHALALLQLDPWNLEADDLAAAITRVLGDKATRRRAMMLGQELRRESGANAAARLIEEFAAAV